MKWLNPKEMKFYIGPTLSPDTMTRKGYIPYYGRLSVDRLSVYYENGVAVIEELPEPAPTENWQSMSLFIGALYELLPADKLVEIMSTPELLKPAIAGMALLSSDLTQGGYIDLMNPKVAEFLALTGITLEQLETAMKSYGMKKGVYNV